MARIFKNKTAEEVTVTYGTVGVVIDAESQKDLSDTFELGQLAASTTLLDFLGQGTDKYQLNDGTKDLTLSEAVDLLRGFSVYKLSDVAVNDGQLVVAANAPHGTRNTIFTFNWCDKTTWYQDAARVVDETATDSGNHLTYTLAHEYVIDTYHGKLSGEDYLVDSNSNSYRVVVKVDGSTKTEQDPHYGTGGDYTVNYEDGEITFLSSQGSSTVTVTYHYAQSSKFIVNPGVMDYELPRVEVQFTKDVIITDSVRFQVTAPIGPGGTRIPVINPMVYKTMFDFINDCDGNYPVLPSFSTSSWRGLPQDILTIPWNYAAVIELIGANGMQLEVFLDHDEPFGGTSATGTFYFLVHENDH